MSLISSTVKVPSVKTINGNAALRAISSINALLICFDSQLALEIIITVKTQTASMTYLAISYKIIPDMDIVSLLIHIDLK